MTSRIREIGIRKAVGATNREIRFQFLAEAILISFIGGFAGIVIGLAIPYSVRFLTEYRIPISGLSAIIAIVVSSVVGVIFGTVPAARAAQLDPLKACATNEQNSQERNPGGRENCSGHRHHKAGLVGPALFCVELNQPILVRPADPEYLTRFGYITIARFSSSCCSTGKAQPAISTRPAASRAALGETP